MHNAGIFQTSLSKTGRTISGVPHGDFDTQKVVLGPVGCRLREKQSFAAADFQFQRGATLEYALRIPRLRQLLGQQQMPR